MATAEGVVVESGSRPILGEALLVTADNVTVAGFQLQGLPAVHFRDLRHAHLHHNQVTPDVLSLVEIERVLGDIRIEDNQFTNCNFEATEHAVGAVTFHFQRNQSEYSIPNQTSALFQVNTATQVDIDYTQNSVRGLEGSLLAYHIQCRTDGDGRIYFNMHDNDDLSDSETGLLLQSYGTSNFQAELTNNTLSFASTAFQAQSFEQSSNNQMLTNNTFQQTSTSDPGDPRVVFNSSGSSGLNIDLLNNQVLGKAGTFGVIGYQTLGTSSITSRQIGNTYHQTRFETLGGTISIRANNRTEFDAANTAVTGVSRSGDISFTPDP